jgi:serine/threonine protein kinase
MPNLNQLGRYRIETKIGSGAFADVYKAVDVMLKRTVALKVLKPTLLKDDEAFGRFVQEAQLASRLFHASIATVLDMGEADGYRYLAMRYVDGPALDRILARQGAMPWAQALAVITQVGAALDYAHKDGLVHRDVKPQNILVGEKEGAVLTDFGLVRALVSSQGLTNTGVMLGTPHYMAPEIWEGEEAGPAADQYALACVLYELLTGQQLYAGKTPPAVMSRHFRPPELPNAWPAGVRPDLNSLLSRALAADPARRFEGMSAFVTALAGQPRVVGQAIPVPDTKPKPAFPADSQPRNPAAIEWVEVPAGEFLFGEEKTRQYLHKPFLIGKYPVTNAEYKRFLDATPAQNPPKDWDAKQRVYPAGKENHPVVNVSWHDAQAFCAWAGCRLPTEVEWERAARGTDGRTYPWGDDWVSGKYCNSSEARIGGTTPVDDYPLGVSPCGAWDMSGNVWEWTSSAEGGGKVLRGGAWDYGYVGNVRTAFRGRNVPTNTDVDIGFRCARSD